MINKQMKLISHMGTLGFDDLVQQINQNFNETYYEPLMAKKYLKILYYSEHFSRNEKMVILEKLSEKMPQHSKDLNLNYQFIEVFFPIASVFHTEICEILRANFSGSIFIFSYCLGKYVEMNPDIISTAKDFLLGIAKNELQEESENQISNRQLVLADSVYYRYEPILDQLYQKAIRFGAIQEKYDAICFGREKIVSLSYDNAVPVLALRLVNPDFEQGLQNGCAYDTYLSIKKSKDTGFVHSYYKCKLCKFCSLLNVSDEEKEIALSLIKRQFSSMKLTDTYFFLTGNIPSYILSIIALLHIELIKLILFSEDTYIILSQNDIRKNMLWGDYITDFDFECCYNAIINHEIKKGYFLPLKDNRGLLIGKWMFNYDMSIIECAKSVALDSKASGILGKCTNFFGKEVFEKIVRSYLKKYNWEVVRTAITLKRNKRAITDVDLLAYKDGVILIGQLKVAHCERTPYQLWKASNTLHQAQYQATLAFNILKNDFVLLCSIFAKEGVKIRKQNVTHIIPIVVTSSNYFTHLDDSSQPIVIGFDMLAETMYYAQESDNADLILHSLTAPTKLYSFPDLTKAESTIETEAYKISYEEFE